jgi:putative ABC transport system ATP-binding protein
MNENNSLFRLESLSKVYRTDSVETTALKAVNIAVRHGEFVAVRGPSGCGKSTLLNIVGMLDKQSAGTFQFLGEDISDFEESQLAEIRRTRLGFVFQSFHLLDELTVRENIEFALLFHKIPASERKSRATEVMDRMKIAHRADHKPVQLSGGQQQRVAVARAVIGKPTLILADEPTGNLDSKNGQEVMELLTELNREGTTILMVTHSQAHAEYARRDIGLYDGEIVSEQMRRGL